MATNNMIWLTQSFALLNLYKLPRTILTRSASSKTNLYEKLGLPEKPKRPTSAFIIFLSSVKPDLLKQNPNMKQSELMKEGSRLWKNVNETEKAVFCNRYKQELEIYKKNMEKYKNSLTPKQRAEIREAEAEIKAIRDKKTANYVKEKRIKLLEKPKKPLNAFLKYYMSKQEENVNQSPPKAFSKIIAEEWKSLPDDVKQKMKSDYEKEYENYLKALLKWEEKMIKEGNIDVVRTKTLKEKLITYS